MSSDEFVSQIELQRRAFEAQFGSLESMGFEDKTKNLTALQSSEESSDGDGDDETNNSEQKHYSDPDDAESQNLSEFEGFSDDDNEQKSQKSSQRQPRVIKFTGPSDTYVPPSKKEQKLLKSGRAPKQTLMESRLDEETNEVHADDNDADDDNLKDDLELQRFLKESHLLSAFGNTASGADLTLQTMDNVEYRDDALMGKARSRTLEMRLNNLSEVNGKNRKLEKVPINVRKGMVNKHLKRINKFEEEAREGGIVLSKVKKGEFRKIGATYRKDIERRIGQSISSKELEKSAKRKRGLKINSIGRSTRNGLVISQADIQRINGTNTKSNTSKSNSKRRTRR